jgi:hypothetical protein
MGDKVIRLDEEFVSKGVFWNPKIGEHKSFSANLTYNPEEGIELDAATLPIEFKDLAQSELEEMDVLVGALSDGTPCILFRVQPWGGSKIWSGGTLCISSPAFRAQFAVIGQAARAAPQPTFDEMHISSEALTVLCGWPAIPFENNAGDVTVHFPRYNDPLMSASVEGATVETRYHRRVRVSAAGHAEGDYRPVITIIPDVAENLEAILEWIVEATGLVTILEGQHAAPYAIQVTTKTDSDDQREKDAYVLFEYVHDFPTRKIRRELAIPFRMLGDKASAVVSKWFGAGKDFRRAVNLFLGTLYRDSFVEARFLSLAQAIESFHRVNYQMEKMDLDLFDKLKSSLRAGLDQVPLDDSVRKDISEGFEFLNEPSFRARLEALVASLAPETKAKLIGDPEEFVRTLKQTRDYLTHAGIPKKGAVLSEPLEYLRFNLRLQALMRLLILRQFGLDEALLLEPVCADLIPWRSASREQNPAQ